MTRRLIGIGLTVAAVSAGAAFVSAQAREQDPQQAGRTTQTIGQREQGPGRRMGPGRGLGPQQGRRGGAQFGRGPGMMGGRGMAMAGRGQGMRGGGAGPGLAALKLTDEQRAKVTDLHRAERDKAAPITDELQLARKALQRELFADKRDAGRIRDLASTIAKLEQRLSDLHISTATSVADVLTAEQRETMRLQDGRRGGPQGPGPRGIGRQR
jgi:Spy/CpxP family protein refolding chaperone